MAYADFYNCNANRKYPFVKHSNGRIYFTGMDLPDYVILDAGFTLNSTVTYDPTADVVQLKSIVWTTLEITFTFEVTDGPLFVFTRSVTDVSGATEYVEAADNQGVGFLITGDMAKFKDTLSAAGSMTSNSAILEPTTVVEMGGQRLQSVNVANLERYTVDNCCVEEATEYNDTTAHTVAAGLIGDIKFKAGHNARVSVDTTSKVLTIYPEQGAGEGEPCTELLRWPEEELPEDSLVYSDGATCGELIYRINASSPSDAGIFLLTGGSGIQVVSFPAENRIDIINDVLETLYCGSDEEPEEVV